MPPKFSNGQGSYTVAKEPESIFAKAPDFYDFNKDRTKECFAVDQIWAIYVDLDVMPRGYAQIDRVYSPFKVDVTWLEFVAGDTDETAWERSGLPVACGQFKLSSKTTTTGYTGSFSHKILGVKSATNCYSIYPRKGETWALYKDWNIKWCSDPVDHRKYEYEFVVVLSDYSKESGILVAHLVKLEGFVCMFKPNKNKGIRHSFRIPPSEMLRFSHRVPSFRRNGKEQRDVFEGYFELDPCSLPSYLKGHDTGANDYGNNVKEDASISAEDKKADSCNSNTEEVAENGDPYEQEPGLFVEVANPQFYDFGSDKREECFAEYQMWAIYKDFDGMPRFYARIDKVNSPFKVDLTWLEFVAGDMDETTWIRSGLPVACGKFKLGKTATTDNIRAFSHKIFWKRSVNKTYNIYPQKGETWALYKNWDITWSSDPDNHRVYEYDFVVVLSEYPNVSGILVANLVKLKGFTSLFKPTKINGMACFQIPSSEILRFSHRIPSVRTNGKEQKDIPEGYFELDTCSLPSNLEEVSEAETVDCNINYWFRSVYKENHPMPKKRKNPDAQSTLDGSSSGENRPSKMSNGCNKNLNEEKWAAEASGGPLDESKAIIVSVGRENVVGHPKEMSPDGVITIRDSEEQGFPSSPLPLKIFEMPETEFCNFDEERSCEKFKTGQIWAMYSKLDMLPKSYVQIENVESFPVFKLVVRLLESSDPPRGIIQWVDKEMPVSSGTFKVTSSEVVVLSDSISFSHLVSELPAVNNVYTIRPRAGEVWAIYSRFCSDLLLSDLKKCEYDIVEILEVVDVHWIIVLVLERVAGFKTVFKAMDKEKFGSIGAIPWIELYRFSHQVPNFMLSGARYGKLRGCWELDPRSLAVL
ncbi:hypothetical protein MKW94_029581 [Papaver nudicaule]|uniref:DUF3444 domain-containing protein n=1 Tax=Papaver nudicaule TaxID=74823 RepID=A0AA41S676_PAPNU|nr:hypothetical protein [Papaver nudicaule]